MISMRHAGDKGDLISALPAMRYLANGGQCILCIEAASYTREMLTPDKWCGIDRLLKAQPYINDVREWKRETVNYNGNDWRSRLFRSIRYGQDREKSLLTWQLEQYGIPASAANEPWITVEPKKIARVVFNRTGVGRKPENVYHNPRFPWHFVWEKYKDDAVFVGLPEEYKVFCATCGSIPHVQTKDLYEAAQVIAGCDLFVGNQSVAVWMAEAMKKRYVLEVWPQGPNVLIFRDGVTHGWNEDVVLPDL